MRHPPPALQPLAAAYSHIHCRSLRTPPGDRARRGKSVETARRRCCLWTEVVRDDTDLGRIPVLWDHFPKKREWSETEAGVTRVTSTEIGPSASTQMISPVMRPTARRSFSTAWRCARAPAVA